MKKFETDIMAELSQLPELFPNFRPIFDEMFNWGNRDVLELSDDERTELNEYSAKLTTVLASDKDLLRGFLNAFAKAIAKNSELIESVRRVVKLYDSLVSKNILLINPLEDLLYSPQPS